MSKQFKRREFITLLGGAASVSVAWPPAAPAQQPVPVIGFLSTTSPDAIFHLVDAFRRGLKESGHVVGQTVVMDHRWAEGRLDRLPVLAAALVDRKVAVIAASGGPPAALAAMAATTTIPIVFVSGADPIEAGLVTSLNRPDGNVTGVSMVTSALGSKRLELLRQIAPRAALIGVLVGDYDTAFQLRDLQEAAGLLRQQIQVERVSSERDIDAAFARFVQQGAGALLIVNDPFFLIQRDQILPLAARHGLPTIYGQREYAAAGGLMSYGTSLADGYRQAGVYVGKILNGAKPAELPVIQPTKFELIINLATAKALGLEVPAQMLALADEVIE
jgi:putative ABC transport system substrate-binding protein